MSNSVLGKPFELNDSSILIRFNSLMPANIIYGYGIFCNRNSEGDGYDYAIGIRCDGNGTGEGYGCGYGEGDGSGTIDAF